MFYEELKKICLQKSTTPSGVALKAGMSKSNVTNWKAGKSPTLETVIKLADELGVSPKDLVPESTTTE